jgi:hypothetical protein
MLLVEHDRLLAIARFRHHLHIRLLIDHRSQPITDYGMIVGEYHANVAVHGRCH